MRERSMLAAYLEGLRRAGARPLLLLGVWLAGLVVAAPAAWVVEAALAESFGSSLTADAMRDGFDMGWYGEFRAEASGLVSTFTPTHTGVGAFLDNLEDWATGGLFGSLPQLLSLGVAWALVWSLLLGGVLTRYAPGSDEGRLRFFEAGGRYFLRFVRLALLAAPLYYGIYWLFRRAGTWLADFTRDTTRESTALLYSVMVVLAIALLLVIVRTCFDYAKVATVLEGRRSMLLAALRGIGFVLANPGRTLGLYLLIALSSLALFALYALVAPGALQSTSAAVWTAFAIGQAFLLARLYLRLSLLAGEMALYQGLTSDWKTHPVTRVPPGGTVRVEPPPRVGSHDSADPAGVEASPEPV